MMSNDPTPHFLATDPDDMTLDDFYVVKVGTGVDLLAPTTRAQWYGALLWYAAKEAGDPIPWTVIREQPVSWVVERLEIPGGDEEEEDDGADPTSPPASSSSEPASPSESSSETPSSGSPDPGE